MLIGVSSLGAGEAASAPTTQPATDRAFNAPPGARITADGWFAPRQPTIKPPKLPEQVARAFVIPIHGPISNTTYAIVRYKIAICRDKGAELIVFDMDTPGGAGDAMESIIEMLTEDLDDIYTVAYVNPDAYSAGALISLACNSIAMVQRGVIGDAMPIIIHPQKGLIPLPKEERAKIESPIRVMVNRLAVERGYNPILCEAMVTVSLELWVIRHRTTGELKIVDASEWKGKVANVPAHDRVAAGPKDAEWVYLRTFDPDNLLVTLNVEKAVFAGLAKNVFGSMADLEKHYNVDATVGMTRLEDRPLDRVAIFLTSTMVTGLLVTILMITVYAEFRTPGIGIFGAIAVLCLLTIIGSRFLVGMANPIEVGVLAVGIVLIIMEIFVIPGFGVAGISGIVLCVAAMLAMWIPNSTTEWPVPKFPADWSLLGNGIFVLLAGFIAATILSAILGKYLPKVSLMTRSRLILPAATAAHDAPRPDDSPYLRIHPGDTGTTVSPLHPVGDVRFNGDIVNAVSDGEMIEKGKTVRVVRCEGNRIVVQEDQT
jgi:membrane-bound serine protease (ClpP class)